MGQSLSSSWWILAVRGVAALLFGILVLIWPGTTLLVLVALFAAYALVSGTVSVIGAVRHRSEKGWWVSLLLGIISVAAGVIAVLNPGLTLVVLVLLVAAHAVVIGVFDIIAAIRLRKEIEREWLLALAGVISIAFGTLVFLFPPAGALAMVYLVSFYAMFTGVLLLTHAVRASTRGKRPDASRDASRGSPRPA